MSERDQKKEKLTEKIADLIEKNGGLVKTSQLYGLFMDYRRIQQFVKEGRIQRVKNGYYGMGFREKSEESILAGFFPDGVLCLESALYHYRYIREKPFCWHIAVDKNTSKSRFHMEYPLIQPYYTEPTVLYLGALQIPFAEGKMWIYDKERLICDCLKYEDKLSREYLKQAILAYLGEPQKNIQKLMEYAKQRRVMQKVQNRIGMWL